MNSENHFPSIDEIIRAQALLTDDDINAALSMIAAARDPQMVLENLRPEVARELAARGHIDDYFD